MTLTREELGNTYHCVMLQLLKQTYLSRSKTDLMWVGYVMT